MRERFLARQASDSLALLAGPVQLRVVALLRFLLGLRVLALLCLLLDPCLLLEFLTRVLIRYQSRLMTLPSLGPLLVVPWTPLLLPTSRRMVAIQTRC